MAPPAPLPITMALSIFPGRPFNAGTAGVGPFGQTLGKNEPAPADAGDDAFVQSRDEAANFGRIAGFEKTAPHRYRALGIDRHIDGQHAVEVVQRGRHIGPVADGKPGADILSQAAGVCVKNFSQRERRSLLYRLFSLAAREPGEVAQPFPV